jgi:hypothetical protein
MVFWLKGSLRVLSRACALAVLPFFGALLEYTIDTPECE